MQEPRRYYGSKVAGRWEQPPSRTQITPSTSSHTRTDPHGRHALEGSRAGARSRGRGATALAAARTLFARLAMKLAKLEARFRQVGRVRLSALRLRFALA